VGRVTTTRACTAASIYFAGIDQCQLGYCIQADSGTGNTWACVALSNDTSLMRFGREETSQLCINRSVLKVNILQCAFNYCILVDGSGKKSCEILSAASNRYGRDANTHECLTAPNTAAPSSVVDSCAQNYCIFKDPGTSQMQCRQLSSNTAERSVGKESVSQFCLDIG